MTNEEKSRILHNVYTTLTNSKTDLDIWIQSTTEILESIYGKVSKELVVFIDMASEYKKSMKNFTGYAQNAVTSNFKVKSKEYLWSLIKKLDPEKFPDTVSDENKYVQAKRTHPIKAATEPSRRKMNEIKTKTLVALSEYKDKMKTMDLTDSQTLLNIYNTLQAYLGADSHPAKFLLRIIDEFDKREFTESETRNRVIQFLDTTIIRIESDIYSPTELGQSYHHDERKYVQSKIQGSDNQSTLHIVPTPPVHSIPPTPSEPTEKKHYLIGIGTFWTVASFVGVAVWYFGFYVGSTKFDREKIDLAEEVIQLKKDTAQLRKDTAYLKERVRSAKEVIDLQDGYIESQGDSLRKLEKKVNE